MTLRHFVLYTLARIGLFAVAFLLVWLLIRPWVEWTASALLWTALLATVLSSIASIFVLRRLRERFALVVHQRAARLSSRVDQARSKEDSPG